MYYYYKANSLCIYLLPSTACSGTLDIMLVVDTTGFTESSWSATKEGIKSVVETIDNSFTISTDGTHVGVVYYNEHATMTLSLQSGTSLSSISQAIDSLAYQDSSYHNMEAGLESARDELNANSRISTGDTYRAVIVFVNELNSDNSAAITESSSLRSQRLIIITVALSLLVSTEDLLPIASSHDDVFSAPSAASLAALWQNSSTADLKPMLCPYGGQTTTTHFNSTASTMHYSHSGYSTMHHSSSGYSSIHPTTRPLTTAVQGNVSFLNAIKLHTI